MPPCEDDPAPLPLTVDGLANVRDLGGLVRDNGSSTPSGVFIRAQTLGRLSPRGWQQLRDHSVRTVIDLRRPEKRTDVAPPPGIRRVSVDLDGVDREFWEPIEADGRWGTPLHHSDHLLTLPLRLAEAVRGIARAEPGAVLFHCGAGWDRTGLLAAVLLRTAGVTAEAATSDYLASFTNAEAMASLHGRSFDVEQRHAILARFGHTAESAFRDAYDSIDVDGWIARAELDEASRSALRTWRGALTADPNA